MRYVRALQVTMLLLAACATVFASASGGVSADPNNPTPANYGWFTGTLGSNDAAWSSFPAAASLRCILAEVGADIAAQVTLKVVSAGASHSVTTGIAEGSDNRIAIASMSPTSVVLGLTSGNNAGGYGGRIRALGTPDLATKNSGAISAPCTHGLLSPLTGNTVNQYTFNATNGEQIVFSLASSAPSTTLAVLRSDGTILNTITSGQMGSIVIPTSGAYSYNVATAGTASPIDYILGTVGGPPGDPGCKPVCTLSS